MKQYKSVGIIEDGFRYGYRTLTPPKKRSLNFTDVYWWKKKKTKKKTMTYIIILSKLHHSRDTVDPF